MPGFMVGTVDSGRIDRMQHETCIPVEQKTQVSSQPDPIFIIIINKMLPELA